MRTPLPVLLVLAVACGAAQRASDGANESPRPQPDSAPRTVSAAPLSEIDFARHGFADAGCFVLHDVSSGAERISSTERCAQPRRPHSTFKIANALIGLDLGLLSGPDAMMTHDFARYPKEGWWFEGWDRDQTLRDAMALSVVPLFRKLASDIGPERMASYLARLDYGNRDISGGIDRFWLEGGLRISAMQQVALVTKLVRDELPVSKQAQAALRDVLRRDPIAGVRHAGKTGTGRIESEASGANPLDGALLAWMVGWLELPRGPVTYAMWIEAPSFDAARTQRTQSLDAVLGEVVTRWR